MEGREELAFLTESLMDAARVISSRVVSRHRHPIVASGGGGLLPSNESLNHASARALYIGVYT